MAMTTEVCMAMLVALVVASTLAMAIAMEHDPTPSSLEASCSRVGCFQDYCLDL